MHKRLGPWAQVPREGAAALILAAATLSGYCECPRVRQRGSLSQRWRGWGGEGVGRTRVEGLRSSAKASRQTEMGFGQSGLGCEAGTHVAGEWHSPVKGRAA